MDYREQFTDEELAHVVEQGLIYMCACPAQVAEGVRKLRELYRYQRACLENPDNNQAVHRAIARRVTEAHHTLQECLEEVITLEGWDRATLDMPPNLRKRQMREMLSDDGAE